MYYRFALILFLMFSYGSAQQDTLRINQLQVIGSHNSYKKAIDPKLFEYLTEKDSTNRMYALQYEHIPVLQQLDMGLRNLELDVYADARGGRFAHPRGMDLVKDQPIYNSEGNMNIPGFKMFHVMDIDFRSEYDLLSDCLDDLKKWSEAHPNHEPIFITLEPKDDKANMFGTMAEPFTTDVYDELDATITKHLSKDHLIIPDDVRGHYSTLENAILHNNWPTVKEAKGKFLFILDAHDEKQAIYAKNHPSLKGRVLFINAGAGTPEAAAMILNNPDDENIPNLVKKGYIIRTRADANTKQARTNDYTNFEAAKKSGAQIITTDYYLPSKLFESDYHVSFENNTFVRHNPVTAK
ncbi:phosphatidylinositol-specific phospholipase C1-like protein [Mariniflexile gromovii]|uniref:Phosphatidylinositol-specific phospholipase C1-like protein n=2 Tax=Mariniflexile gromovii TaxID=362523 RepID=A0ABS4BWN0_9FLAO|nr:phosphatidylinositol-specific phospholipase C1-like protein [Mariniflexile gromovii]MBP0904999.1 phosphatidylinositol-specific phospholipase C1-like protein [Mariniflexile gromovii]